MRLTTRLLNLHGLCTRRVCHRHQKANELRLWDCVLLHGIEYWLNLHDREAVFDKLGLDRQLYAYLPLRLEVNLVQVGTYLARVVGMREVNAHLELLRILRLSHELYLLFRLLADTGLKSDCLLYDERRYSLVEVHQYQLLVEHNLRNLQIRVLTLLVKQRRPYHQLEVILRECAYFSPQIGPARVYLVVHSVCQVRIALYLVYYRNEVSLATSRLFDLDDLVYERHEFVQSL